MHKHDLLSVELFDFVYYRDLEMLEVAQGHQRWYRAVSYQQFIVTMAVSLAVCEISASNNGVTLKTGSFKVIENGTVR